MPRSDLAQQHSIAMSEHLSLRTVAIVIHDANDTPIEVGSGTCVQIEDRHLVSTAAHLLDNVTRARDLGVAAFGRVGELSNQTPKVARWGRRGGRDAGDAVDIAWLEIEPKAVPSWIATWKRTFVPLERIRIEPVAVGAHVYVFGQPGDYVRSEEIEGAPFLGLKPLPFLTGAIATPEGLPGADLYAGYPTEMQTADGPKPMPRAFGLSGCGMWVVNSSADQVWSPDRAQLAAVQRSWREFEWLRGTSMREWLRMVREDLPELAATIDAVLNVTA